MCFSGPGSELDMVRHQIIKEGYLDCKSKYLGMVSHWETNYFALTGRGLFHYSRQGDKEPKMIYELDASNCAGCRRVSDEENKHAFEVGEWKQQEGLFPCHIFIWQAKRKIIFATMSLKDGRPGQDETF